MSALREFTPVSIQYGDRRVRGFRVECKKCGEAESLPVNTFRGSEGDDNGKAVQVITRKFENRGWKVGHNARNDLCLKCATAGDAGTAAPVESPKPQRTRPTLTLVRKPMVTTTAPAMPAASKPTATKPAASVPQPRPLGVKDALTISTKLNEVYIDREKGYGNGWTDAKVAADLAVPRDWVRTVRVEVYGEGAAGNDDITTAIDEARRFLEEAKLTLASAERLNAEAQRALAEANAMRSRIEKTERTVSDIEKSLR